MKDVLELPESFFMLYDTIVCVDHFFQQCKVFTYLKVGTSLEEEYERCRRVLQQMAEVLHSRDVPLPEQGPIKLDQYVLYVSVFKEGEKMLMQGPEK
jgi:anthranilate synthase component 1